MVVVQPLLCTSCLAAIMNLWVGLGIALAPLGHEVYTLPPAGHTARMPVCRFRRLNFLNSCAFTNLEASHNEIMGDHQDCHSILCILHILYPEVPNRGPGIVEFTLIGWMLARIFFSSFLLARFFLKDKGLLEIFGGNSATTPSNI